MPGALVRPGGLCRADASTHQHARHRCVCGAGAYKIPTANDVPVDLRVTLLRNAPNARAVHSSKAVGEPPFHLGASVHFAIKDAVYAARCAAGLHGFFALDTPCTPERIRMACAGPLCADASGHHRPALSC
jgi:xanthine dehydrogenase/oxidase